ncbi:ABC transporter permease [Pikeienuella sp. HZG-20]|uniref:ABC transporter permease n=1 Tax=Paludibacillus litoralis TaxID=3133267 RepID=UPI0030EEF027
MESWRRSIPAFAAFAGPTALWLSIFFLIPIGIIWVYSFGENVTLTEIRTTWTLDNYARIFQPEIITLFWRTVRLAGVATIVCIVVAYPVALVIATAESRWKPWLLLIIMLPFWTNLLVRTYAMLNILGARGRLNGALEWLWHQGDALAGVIGLAGLLGERFTPVTFLGTELGVTLGLVYVHLPFAILPIYSALERLDRSYLEASMDLGAGQVRTFFLILVPLTSAGLATAAIITFIPALGSFLTPDLLGRGQVDMIANVIERQFKRANDWPFGSALSLFLLYVTFIILAIRAVIDMRAARGRRA